MLGSGMNSAAVTWYILQATHSEVSLAALVVLQTIPAMLMMPFSGVLIDREDRRRLVMILDAGRALIILGVAVLALRGEVALWHLYAMNILVSAGFWMFWPTITALIQELTPDTEYAHANAFLMAGVQGGWLIAGGIVGFIYNTVGLSGVLLIDFCTYLLSFLCYLGVRKGRHVVAQVHHHHVDKSAVSRFFHEMREGFVYLRTEPRLVLLGITWALFIGGMMTQNVVGAPVSERLLHAGAVGYGWLNAGWGVGAFLSAVAAARLLPKLGSARVIVVCMLVLAISLSALPFSRWLAVAVACFFAAGAARGIGGVALTSSMMEIVPKHFMGRVQNAFALAATALQVSLSPIVGMMAHRWSLTAAILLIGGCYGAALFTALRFARTPHVQLAYEVADEIR